MKKTLVLPLFLLLCCLSACGSTAQNANADTAAEPAPSAEASPAAEPALNAEPSSAADPALDAAGDFDADAYYSLLVSCKEQIEAITDFKPEIVLVLGTGLGSFVEKLEAAALIPYDEIDGWPSSTAPQHEGNLVFADYKGLKLAVMQGRLHLYEGYDKAEVVLPLRVLRLLGADTVILTNAVGSLNEAFKVGEYVCVRDHISSFVESPLRGENIDELGERFPGMTDLYDRELQDMVLTLGKELDIPVHSGVFLQTPGPQYETPAEIRMFRLLGADTVSMSTAVEAIAAGHMGMRVCAINNITNMAAGMEEAGFSTESIHDSSENSKETFVRLMEALLDRLAGSRAGE